MTTILLFLILVVLLERHYRNAGAEPQCGGKRGAQAQKCLAATSLTPALHE